MSVCRCSERTEPIDAKPGSNRPARLWRVVDRYCNYSAFNGGHRTYSDYSALVCLRCGAHWRTKANYVAQIDDRSEEELNISSGTELHRKAMEARGRTVHETHAWD